MPLEKRAKKRKILSNDEPTRERGDRESRAKTAGFNTATPRVSAQLSFFRSWVSVSLGFLGHRFFPIGGRLAVGFVLSGSHRIEPLPEPSFLRPGPVMIRVGVERRRFHFDLR